MIVFQDVQVAVQQGTGSYQGTALFSDTITNAQVALRGLNLPGYENGDQYHYRGPTIVQITGVNFQGTGLTFTFNFNYSETPSYQMVGAIDFLVIADIKTA